LRLGSEDINDDQAKRRLKGQPDRVIPHDLKTSGRSQQILFTILLAYEFKIE
jgi:hypothetical protein